LSMASVLIAGFTTTILWVDNLFIIENCLLGIIPPLFRLLEPRDLPRCKWLPCLSGNFGESRKFQAGTSVPKITYTGNSFEIWDGSCILSLVALKVLQHTILQQLLISASIHMVIWNIYRSHHAWPNATQQVHNETCSSDQRHNTELKSSHTANHGITIMQSYSFFQVLQ
jgi:hypothetical protein